MPRCSIRSMAAHTSRVIAALALAVATLVLGPINGSAQDAPARPLPDSLIDQRAPDTFLVEFQTTAGRFLVRAHREWSPHGVDRLYHLVRLRYFDGVVIYRVVPDRFAQFGLTDDAEVNRAWREHPIPDEPVVASNTKGRIHFARGGPNTRSNQLSIMRGDNAYLDDIDANGVVGFPPVAEVVEGIEVIDALNEEHGNEPLSHYDSIAAKGREYLDRVFPGLDVIRTARLVE
ncbi:MAG: peptidylprolyl isomerase [Gemmatimonadota bacterium]